LPSTDQPRNYQQQSWHDSGQLQYAHSHAGFRRHCRDTRLRKETEDQDLHIHINTQRKKSNDSH
jgi:hypothetical protein